MHIWISEILAQIWNKIKVISVKLSVKNCNVICIKIHTLIHEFDKN